MNPDDVDVIVIRRRGKLYECSVRYQGYTGWALQDTEELARDKALLRLQSEVEGWWR